MTASPPDAPAAELSSSWTPAVVPRWRGVIRLLLGAVLGGIAVWLAVGAAGGLEDTRDALARVQVWWLAPAALVEGLSYVFAGVRLRRLAGSTIRLGVAPATGVELVVNGLGLLMPAAPAEGLAFEASELSRRGCDRRQTLLTMGFEQWFNLRVFLLVNALNLLWIVIARDLPVDPAWTLAGVPLVLLALAATAVLANRARTVEALAIAVGALRFWTPRTSRVERRAAGAMLHAEAMAVLGPIRQRAVYPLLTAVSLLANVACLYLSLVAAHARVGFDVAILAAAAAAAAGLIPFLPGGVGVVEAIIPAVVHRYGPPFQAALAGAFIYRALGTFLPAAGGAIALLVLRGRRSKNFPDLPRAAHMTGLG